MGMLLHFISSFCFFSFVHPQHPALLLHPDYAAATILIGSNSTTTDASAAATMATVATVANGGKRQLKVDLEGERGRQTVSGVEC